MRFEKVIANSMYVLSLAVVVPVVLWSTLSPLSLAQTEVSARQTLERISPIDYEIVLKLEAKRGKKFDDRELIAATNSKAFDIEYPKTKAAFCARSENAKSLACRESAQLKSTTNQQ